MVMFIVRDVIVSRRHTVHQGSDRLVFVVYIAALSLPWLSGGCGSPAKAQLQRYEPQVAAAKAIELYDRNADGKLSADELVACPALKAGGRRVDANGDGSITAEEIAARFQAYETQSDLIPLAVRVTAKGQPLVGAELTLTPEPFMGESLQSYTGTTATGGGCGLQGTERELPGLPIGFYQVKVVHAGQGIDEVRGCEIADDASGNRLEIAL